MKALSRFATLSILAGLLWSCGGGEEPVEDPQPTEPEVEKTCTWRYDQASTGVYWTAYKFNDKAPVKGKFEGISLWGVEDGETVEEILSDVKMNITTNTVNSDNVDRDKKIAELYFGTNNCSDIVGTIKSAADGKGVVSIMMSEVEKDVDFTYTFEGGVLKLNMEINVEEWNGGPGIASLNEACKDLHTGSDGESKLWPDVSVMVETTLIEDCK